MPPFLLLDDLIHLGVEVFQGLAHTPLGGVTVHLHTVRRHVVGPKDVFAKASEPSQLPQSSAVGNKWFVGLKLQRSGDGVGFC